MKYNGIEVGLKLDSKSRSFHPDTAKAKGLKALHDTELALQDIYKHAANYAYKRTELIQFLQGIDLSNISVPESVFDSAKYKEVYKNHSLEILKDIERYVD